MDKSIIVSVRLPESELRRLQLLAQVYQRSVGELIRVAVGKHVEELTRTDEFKARGLELQRRNEQMLNELLEVSGATGNDPSLVRGVPRSGAQGSKLSVIEPARDAPKQRSLVRVEIVPSTEYAQFGAAASHNASAPPSTRRRLQLLWKEGEHEWCMEGLSSGPSHELVLSSADGSQPESITWKNPATGRRDALKLERSSDGRTLVRGISLAQAQKRAEALRDATAGMEQIDLLPVVQLEAV